MSLPTLRPSFATWKQTSRRKLRLWEGMGAFGDHLLASIDRRPDGSWQARYALETDEQIFAKREDSIQYLSQRAAKEHSVEVRTSTRIVSPRVSLQPVLA